MRHYSTREYVNRCDIMFTANSNTNKNTNTNKDNIKLSFDEKQLLMRAIEFYMSQLQQDIQAAGRNAPEVLTQRYAKYEKLLSRLQFEPEEESQSPRSNA